MMKKYEALLDDEEIEVDLIKDEREGYFIINRINEEIKLNLGDVEEVLK